MIDNIKEQNGVLLQGHIKIHNPETGEYLWINVMQFIMKI